MLHRTRDLLGLVLAVVAMAFLLAGCASFDKESLNTAQKADKIYQQDVYGGHTPEGAVVVMGQLVELYRGALEGPAAGADGTVSADAQAEIDVKVASFTHALESLNASSWDYDAAVDFFAAAIRYEESKR